MKIENLSEDEQAARIRATAHDAEQQAYVASLAAAIDEANQPTADEADERAKAIAAAAEKRGVAGPFLTDAERYRIHRSNVATLEGAFIDAELRAAGGDADADPKAIEDAKKALAKIAPPKVEDEARGPLSGPRRGLI